MTLDEFRESLDRERWTTLADHNDQVTLQSCELIEFGEYRCTTFEVSRGPLTIYKGQNFSTATRRYWESINGGAI